MMEEMLLWLKNGGNTPKLKEKYLEAVNRYMYHKKSDNAQ